MKVGDNTVARFNIATNETYKDRSGNLRNHMAFGYSLGRKGYA